MDLHIVVEEENGGNGTLGMVRANLRGDEAVVLEPSRLRLLATVRGAVWFRLVISGRASHSGQAAKGMSALNLAIEAKTILEGYHADLLAESRGDARFVGFTNPMPLTFGRLRSGEWPAMTPDEAILEGVMGFLPNRTRDQVIGEMKEALLRKGSPELAANHVMSFMYRHDCHVIAPDAPLVSSLQAAVATAGLSPELGAMPASCDSWFYSNLMGIPTIVFGAGDLAVAHTADEHLDLGQLEVAAGILAHHLCSA
jgi:acetylornithine deacetylase